MEDGRGRQQAAPVDPASLLRSIVSSTDDAVVAKDLDAVVTMWNRGAERLYGWTADEMIGRPIATIVPEDRAGEEQRLLARVVAGERVEHYRTERVRKDGTRVWVSVTLSPIVERGEIVGASAIARDLTTAIGAESLAADLLESAPDAMIVVDTDGAIVHANRQAYALFAYSTGELVGRSIDDLVPVRLRRAHAGHRLSFAKAPVLRPMGTGSQELIASRSDGSEFPVEISLSPVRSWRGDLVSAAIRDASDRKQAEAALKQALAREQEATAQLREVDRLKDEFLSTVSHELRTPVTAIGGFAELLEESEDEIDRDRRVHLLRRIITNAGEMHTMVEQLLDYSRLAGGRVVISPTRVLLEDAVQGVLRAHERELAEHEVRVEVDTDVWINVDRVGFGRIVGNFLSNAAKFSDAGSTITVTARRAEDEIVVAVTDEGIGIPADDLERVFERFFQSAARTSVRGAGIGLSVASRYAEMHGGRLDVRSALGEGSTFSFHLPLSVPEAS